MLKIFLIKTYMYKTQYATETKYNFYYNKSIYKWSNSLERAMLYYLARLLNSMPSSITERSQHEDMTLFLKAGGERALYVKYNISKIHEVSLV